MQGVTYFYRKKGSWSLSINEGHFPNISIHCRKYVVPVYFNCAIRVFGKALRVWWTF